MSARSKRPAKSCRAVAPTAMAAYPGPAMTSSSYPGPSSYQPPRMPASAYTPPMPYAVPHMTSSYQPPRMPAYTASAYTPHMPFASGHHHHYACAECHARAVDRTSAQPTYGRPVDRTSTGAFSGYLPYPHQDLYNAKGFPQMYGDVSQFVGKAAVMAGAGYGAAQLGSAVGQMTSLTGPWFKHTTG